MLRFTRVSRLLALPALLVLGLAGAKIVSPAQGAAGLVATGSAHILTNASGKTLYIFTMDNPKMHTSACTGTCAAFWPPVLVPAGSTPPAKVPGVPGKFGEIMLKGGKAQLTYAGWPLYTYSKDGDSGDAYGQGIGGNWWAVVVNRGK